MIKIIYALSVILLFMLAMLIKKKEDKMDFLVSLFVGFMLLFCYNIIVCTCLCFVIKNITLESLIIINLLLSVLLGIKIFKDKKIQKFLINKKDILAICIISIIGFIACVCNFKLPFETSFICTDAANHYDMAMDFCQNGNISFGSMSGLQINYGLCFKVLFDTTNKISGFYIFIVLEIIKLIFSGILFYLTINKLVKTKVGFIIGTLIAIIYMISYPLNGIVSGFSYFQMAINIVSTIILVMVKREYLGNNLKNIVLFMLCFGLMFTYYLLVPITYIAVFLYEIKDFKKEKLKTFLNELIIFFIPCVLGILFYLVLIRFNTKVVEEGFSFFKAMKNEGYIFVNYITAFIPFIIYNIVYIFFIKKENKSFLTLFCIINFLYIIFTALLFKLEIISRYYFMKTYYTMWLISLLITAVAILRVLNSDKEKLYKVISVIPIVFYILFVVYFIIVKGTCSIKVFEHKNEDLTSMFDVYRINLGQMTHESFELIYSNEELQLINELSNEFDDNTKIIYEEDTIAKMWFKSILVIKDEIPLNKLFTYSKEDQEELINYLVNTDEQIYVVSHNGVYIRLAYKDFTNMLKENLKVYKSAGRVTIYTNK